MDKSKAEQVTHFTLLFAFCAASMTHQDEEMGDFDLLPEFAQEPRLGQVFA